MANRIALTVATAGVLLACEKAPDQRITTGGDVAPSEPSTALGEIEAVDGSVGLRRDEKKIDASTGDAVQAGDLVFTGDASRVRIVFSDGSILAIGPSSKLLLSAYARTDKARSGSLKVLAGQFWLRVTELVGVTTDVDIETPTAVAGIRGTTLWGDTERDLLCALAGTVEVNSKSGPTATLQAGECLSKTATESPEKLTPEEKQVRKFLGEVHIGEPLEAQ
ncbi:MAG: FecR family protein [Myxococcota bacterium]